jgi:citrate lyase subunit beta/citryl-CoA lyase
VMGTNDLAKELHAEHVPGRAPLLGALSLALLAARRILALAQAIDELA